MEGIRKRYRESFAQKAGASGLSLGMENEYVAVSRKDIGRALRIDETLAIFKDVERNNSAWSLDEKNVTLHYAGFGVQELTIGTDVGSGTVEINFPPVSRTACGQQLLRQGHNLLDDTMRVLVDSANHTYAIIEGLGITPLSRPGKDIMAPKARYAAFEEVLDPHRFSYHALTASAQVHISTTSAENAIAMMNVANMLAPITIALNANSAIFECKDSGFLDFRPQVWDMARFRKRTEFNKKRVGIADVVSNIDDYFDNLMGYDPIITKRGDEYLRYVGIEALGEFMEKGAAIAKPITDNGYGETRRIYPEMTDMYFQDSMVWWEARLKSAYGTVESRGAAQQPSNVEAMAVAAFILGTSSNIERADQLLSQFSVENARQARNDVKRMGLRASMGGIPITELATNALNVASEGLEKIGESTSYLDPLLERANTGMTPAERSLQLFDKTGLGGFVIGSQLII